VDEQLKTIGLNRWTWFLFSLFAVVNLTAQPAGYYDSADGLSGESLQVALHNIIKDHTVRSYDQLWTDFQSTDDKANGYVWDMYSDVPDGTPPYNYVFISDQCGSYSNEGDCYNREHSFPSSWFNDASPMNSDLFHLVPTDGEVNGHRSNFPYGEVGSVSWTSLNGSKLGTCNYPGYTGTTFEPINEYKGDFARNYFYMATRYSNLIAGWENNDANADAILNGTSYPAYEEWFLNMIRAWNLADPVSQKEIDRNNAVYGFQNNRNPYIDHPEYVELVWGDGYDPEPANHVTDFSAHCIVLNWMDATGTTLPDGYLIRMSAVGFAGIANPTDGVPVGDDFSNKNKAYGIQTATFGGLTPAATYYFKIFPYAGNGASIDYKLDGTIPQVSLMAN